MLLYFVMLANFSQSWPPPYKILVTKVMYIAKVDFCFHKFGDINDEALS